MKKYYFLAAYDEPTGLRGEYSEVTEDLFYRVLSQCVGGTTSKDLYASTFAHYKSILNATREASAGGVMFKIDQI